MTRVWKKEKVVTIIYMEQLGVGWSGGENEDGSGCERSMSWREREREGGRLMGNVLGKKL